LPNKSQTPPAVTRKPVESEATLGKPEESVKLLAQERERQSDHLDDAVSATLALALIDVGRTREAVSVAVAVAALAPHLPLYQRSMSNYARLLLEERQTPPRTHCARRCPCLLSVLRRHNAPRVRDWYGAAPDNRQVASYIVGIGRTGLSPDAATCCSSLQP